jgi:hypothetical protein
VYSTECGLFAKYSDHSFWVGRVMGYALVYPSVMLVTWDQPEHHWISGFLAGNSKLHAYVMESFVIPGYYQENSRHVLAAIRKSMRTLMRHSFNYRACCFASHASSGLCRSFLAVSQSMNTTVPFHHFFQPMLWWDLTLIHTRV